VHQTDTIGVRCTRRQCNFQPFCPSAILGIGAINTPHSALWNTRARLPFLYTRATLPNTSKHHNCHKREITQERATRLCWANSALWEFLRRKCVLPLVLIWARSIDSHWFVNLPRAPCLCGWPYGVSHPDLRTNPDASHMCARIKFHTYGDSVYRNQCTSLLLHIIYIQNN
jgi:hypothetical protein